MWRASQSLKLKAQFKIIQWQKQDFNFWTYYSSSIARSTRVDNNASQLHASGPHFKSNVLWKLWQKVDIGEVDWGCCSAPRSLVQCPMEGCKQQEAKHKKQYWKGMWGSRVWAARSVLQVRRLPRFLSYSHRLALLTSWCDSWGSHGHWGTPRSCVWGIHVPTVDQVDARKVIRSSIHPLTNRCAGYFK